MYLRNCKFQVSAHREFEHQESEQDHVVPTVFSSLVRREKHHGNLRYPPQSYPRPEIRPY